MSVMVIAVAAFSSAALRSRPVLLRAPAVPRSAATSLIRCVCDDTGPPGASVSGVLYSAADAPTVRLFTKSGCTLCDVAKGVLADAAAERPHTLEAVDITDADKGEWYEKYKYDIPVLHIDGAYWAKHRITLDESLEALAAASEGTFEPRKGEPDAGRLERK